MEIFYLGLMLIFVAVARSQPVRVGADATLQKFPLLVAFHREACAI